MKPMTAAELDARVSKGCDTPDCNCSKQPLFINGNCHPGGGVEARYYEGLLTIRCYVCERPIITLEVK